MDEKSIFNGALQTIQDNNSSDQLVRKVNMFANNLHISTLKQYDVSVYSWVLHIVFYKIKLSIQIVQTTN